MADAIEPAATPQRNYIDYLEDEPPPPPPKKKRSNKEARAEKRRLEEIEFRKLEMRDLLRRELELSQKTVKKTKQAWLEMLRNIKLERMKEELQSWEAKTNRVLKQKDEQITSILDDMETTEEIHQRVVCTQLETLDYLTDVFQAFQRNLGHQYENQSKEMVHDFHNKTCELLEIQDAYEQKFIKNLNETNASLQSQLYRDYDNTIKKRNDGVDDEILKRYNMRDTISKKMDFLHKQLLEFVKSLLDASLDPLKFEKLNHLMIRQRNFGAETKKLNETETKSEQTLQELQQEFQEVDVEEGHKINDLKQEYAYFLDVHKNIDNRMNQNREETHNKLKALTTECYDTCRTLKKIQSYGELLLSLSVSCRKLQTESEKVTLASELVIQGDAPDIDEFKLQALDLKAHIDLNEAELRAHMMLMKNFWRRQALAEAQCVLLEHKKRELLDENEHYINRIKALSKADDVSDLQNALTIECVLEEPIPCSTMR